MKLKSTNESNGFIALRAFLKQQGIRSAKKSRDYSFSFEHGQLWIHDIRNGANWSVVDAEGGDSVDGFDFEQISRGED